MPSRWTGFYAGVHIGNASSTNDWNKADLALSGADPFPGRFTSGGMFGGFQFGYNYQINRIVLGIETDASLAGIDGDARCAVAIYTCNTRIDALGTVTARLGYTYDKFLFFGKGGAVWAHEKFDLTPSPSFDENSIYNGKQLRWGWTVGAGAEYAFTPVISGKLEYNYLALGQDSVRVADQFSSVSNVSVAQQAHLIKLGMNYKLGTTTTSGESSESSARTLGPSWIWTGLYGGIHFGGGWGTTNWKSADGMLGAASTLTFPGSGSAEGSIAGGQIGFNRQFGSWVAGAEISASWSNLDGYAKCATTLTPENSYVCHSRIESLVMTTGRLGQTYGNLLFYGLGGAAWATERRDVYQTFGMNYFSGSNDRFGYVLGSGIEYAFTAAWSGRLEYNYVDLGTKAAVISDQFGNKSSVSATQDLHLFKVGMNYKFGADPMTPGESGSLVRNAPPLSSDWQVEAGGRYWFSTGKSQQDLYSNSSPGIINSRLIYGRMDGHSAETFVRFDHHSGLFAKGNFGLGTLVNGRLNDEDMPPFHTPYSNTVSDMRSGTLRYGSLDIGHDILNGPGGKLGPFVGYRYFDQRGRGFGCAQVASSDICEGTGGAAIDRLALTETEQWRGVAVGLNSRMALSPRWKLELDAAYIPYVDRAGVDNHWGRADINPGPETGHGWGTQLEAILSYAVSERVSLGVGGRYWYFTTTHAGSQFPNVPNPSPLKFTSERYGGFLQASYKFGGPEHPARQAEQDWAANWNGIYVGGHLGGGFGRSDWTDPYPASVSGDRVRTGGVLGGAQLGFNYQTGNIVFGPEISGSLAKLEGTETCFGAEGGMNCENKIDALGTLTGRAGYVSGRSLFYAKSGAATARAKYMLNSTGIGGSISTASAVNWGWTAGGGVEHALTARWSVRLEYGYFDFGSRSIIFTVPGALSAVASEPVNSKLHQLLLGVNYHFDALSRPAN